MTEDDYVRILRKNYDRLIKNEKFLHALRDCGKPDSSQAYLRLKKAVEELIEALNDPDGEPFCHSAHGGSDCPVCDALGKIEDTFNDFPTA
jgi:hypothetical protein